MEQNVSNVKIWAHRGANEYAPENTVEAFELLEPTDLTINIELKTNVFSYPGIERRILEMADEYGLRDRIWIYLSLEDRVCIW